MLRIYVFGLIASIQQSRVFKTCECPFKVAPVSRCTKTILCTNLDQMHLDFELMASRLSDIILPLRYGNLLPQSPNFNLLLPFELWQITLPLSPPLPVIPISTLLSLSHTYHTISFSHQLSLLQYTLIYLAYALSLSYKPTLFHTPNIISLTLSHTHKSSLLHILRTYYFTQTIL